MEENKNNSQQQTQYKKFYDKVDISYVSKLF